MFKKYWVAGLLFWVPTIVTVVCISFLLDAVTSIFDLLPRSFQPEYWLGFRIPGIEIALILLVVWISGVLVANFVGRKVVSSTELLVKKLPLVNSLYSGVKQIMQIMVKPNGTAFQQVVFIPFPQKDSWSVGLVTQVVEQKKKDDDAFVVFVPTTPNPTSGYVVTVYRKDLIILDMTVDEALKYIISLGTLSHDALKEAYAHQVGEK